MKKANIFLAAAFALVLFSCKSSGDAKIPEIADDFCNCFKQLDASLSGDSKAIFIKAGSAEDPEKALKEEIEKLPDEKKMAVGMEFMKIADMENPSSELGGCFKNIEKKYDKVYTMNEKKSMQKLIEMLEKKGCTTAMAIMKMGYKQKYK